jgi:hypothetical protein
MEHVDLTQVHQVDGSRTLNGRAGLGSRTLIRVPCMAPWHPAEIAMVPEN